MHGFTRSLLGLTLLLPLHLSPPLTGAEYDRDGDSVIDALDDFPDDATRWLAGTNPNGSDAGPGLEDTPDNMAGVHLLMDKARDRHIGGGHYGLSQGEIGFNAYTSSVDAAKRTAASLGTQPFDGMGITLNSAGEATGGPALGDGWVIHRLYYLGLARYLRPGTGAETRIRSFYKWLRWRGFSGESLANYRYMSATGNAFLLTRDLIPPEDHPYFLNCLWSVTYRDGSLRDLATTGVFHPQELEKLRNADVLRSCMQIVLGSILILPEDTHAQREVKLYYLAAYRRTIIWAAGSASGIAPFLKPDFSAHHHYSSYASAYSPYGAVALAGTIELFRSTPYQLADHHLEYLTGYARELFFYAHLDHTPVGLSGRIGTSSALTGAYSLLALTALAGSSPRQDILQVIANTGGATRISEGYDPTAIMHAVGMPHHVVLRARACQEIQRQGITPQPITGVRTYPYAALAAVRRENWALTIKGFSRWWHSYEGGRTSTNPENLFGIYDCNGVAELHYFTPSNPTGGSTLNLFDRPTMDMAHRPGATTPIRSHEDMYLDSIDSRMKMNSTSVGAVHLNHTDGLFIFDMKNLPATTRDASLRAKKSYFMFGNKVIMLGSGITYQNSKNYPLHTTLYQTKLNQSNRTLSPTWDNAESSLTGDDYGSSTTTGSSGHVLVDSDGTGYYLAPQQSLRVERKKTDVLTSTPEQNTRSGAFRALAWIDHGINPTNATYEYVMIPNATYAAMEAFRANQTGNGMYTVIERSDRAHIVHDQDLHLWGYALFNDFQDEQKGPLLNISVHEALPHVDPQMPANPGYGVIINDRQADRLEVGVSYLDLRLFKTYYQSYGAGTEAGKAGAGAVVRLVVHGLWVHDGQGNPVTVSHTGNGDTILDVTCTHGFSRHLSLAKADQLSGSITTPTSTLQAPEGHAGSTAITLTFSRTGGAVGPKDITYTTTPGTAQEGEDYLAASGSLHWNGGDATDQSITLTLRGDTQYESDETFQITYQETHGEQPPGPSQAITMTIADDDVAPPVLLAQPTPTTVVRGASASLRVVANGEGLTYQWYQGAAGDMTQALANGTASLFVSPAVTADLTLWVRVSNPAGHVDSASVQVRVVEQAPTSPTTPGTESGVAKADTTGGSGGCGSGTILGMTLAGAAWAFLRHRGRGPRATGRS